MSKSLGRHSWTKAVGTLTVALGGLDQIIFSGGIGEHAAPVRARIGAMLACLGVVIDADANHADAPIISSSNSEVPVQVIAVDEGRQIVREMLNMKIEQRLSLWHRPLRGARFRARFSYTDG